MSAPQTAGNERETLGIQDSSLATQIARRDLQDPVQLDLAGPPLSVPGARADVDVIVVAAVVAAVVLAREHERQQPFAGTANNQNWPILALAVVLFVGDPCPDDFAGVGGAVGLGSVRHR